MSAKKRRFFARIQRSLRKISKHADRRGKHTKASREKAQQARAAYLHSLTHRVCVHCSGTQFVDTADQANRVCNQCGLVDEERSVPDMDSVSEYIRKSGASSIYRHRNYFAERIRQFNNTEPRFSTLEKSQIYAVQSVLERKIGSEWSPGLLSKDKFGTICRILDQLRPGQRWRQKLERWHQAKIELSCRAEYAADLPPSELTHKMKVLFDGFAYIFEKFFRSSSDDQRRRLNIPKLDLVCLLLLYNIDKNQLWRYGWFFMSPQIYWESQSVQRDYERCQQIMLKTNESLVRLEPGAFVRRETLHWFRVNKFVVPSLNELRSWIPHDWDRHSYVPYTVRLCSSYS